MDECAILLCFLGGKSLKWHVLGKPFRMSSVENAKKKAARFYFGDFGGILLFGVGFCRVERCFVWEGRAFCGVKNGDDHPLLRPMRC